MTIWIYVDKRETYEDRIDWDLLIKLGLHLKWLVFLWGKEGIDFGVEMEGKVTSKLRALIPW